LRQNREFTMAKRKVGDVDSGSRANAGPDEELDSTVHPEIARSIPVPAYHVSAPP